MNNWSNSNSDLIEDIKAAIEAVEKPSKPLTPIYVNRNYYNALIKYCNKECSLAYFMYEIIGE